MHRILFIIAFLLAAYGITRAQDFNYTVNTDSVAWNELNAQTILNTSNRAWNFSYRIPIGFTFHFCGRDFDSLTIETNGYIVFDQDRNYAITAFSGVGDHMDGNGNHAVLGYELSGTSGNHILKLQYLNCSPYATGDEILSWQVWLKENGNVEIRTGPGTLCTNTFDVSEFNEQTESDTIYEVTEADTAQCYRIGLLNMNMNAATDGLFIGNDPSDPDAITVDENHAEIPHINSIPKSGHRFTFTPSN